MYILHSPLSCYTKGRIMLWHRFIKRTLEPELFALLAQASSFFAPVLGRVLLFLPQGLVHLPNGTLNLSAEFGDLQALGNLDVAVAWKNDLLLGRRAILNLGGRDEVEVWSIGCYLVVQLLDRWRRSRSKQAMLDDEIKMIRPFQCFKPCQLQPSVMGFQNLPLQ